MQVVVKCIEYIDSVYIMLFRNLYMHPGATSMQFFYLVPLFPDHEKVGDTSPSSYDSVAHVYIVYTEITSYDPPMQIFSVDIKGVIWCGPGTPLLLTMPPPTGNMKYKQLVSVNAQSCWSCVSRGRWKANTS